MEKVDLPMKTAQEPEEGAHQPMIENNLSVHNEPKQKKQGITMAEGTMQSSEISSSQCKSSYKEVLSQPKPGLSHGQRLQWLQMRRGPGLWAQCDDCGKWRYLPQAVDSHDLPDKWYCRMNPDPINASDCSVEEVPIRLRDEEDLIHSEYSAGSVVWARLTGWPWWPAMVDDCPDTEQFYWLDGFSDIPTHYNVVYFDGSQVSRSWLTPENIKPYNAANNILKHANKNKKDKKRLEVAFKQADDAVKLPLASRLAKYSFVARYRGTVVSPKKLSKRELEKYKNKLKLQLDIDSSEESESDSDANEERVTRKRRLVQNKNIIILGTPKAKRVKRSNNEYTEIKKMLAANAITQRSLNKDLNHNYVKPVESTVAIPKDPDSMTVQIGSTLVNDENDTLPIDNDSSKTYLPESEIPRTADTLQTEAEFHVRIATPSSDDFEF